MKLEISPHQVAPVLRSMFRLDMPTGNRVFAVLAGSNHGRIFTDDSAHPRWHANSDFKIKEPIDCWRGSRRKNETK